METNSRNELNCIRIEEPTETNCDNSIEDSNDNGFDCYRDEYDFYPDSVL